MLASLNHIEPILTEVAIQSGIYWFLAFGFWINLRILRYADLSLENTLLLGGMGTCRWAVTTGFGLGGTIALFFPIAALLGLIAWGAWKGLRIHAVIVSLALSYILYSVLLQSFGAVVDGTGLPKIRPNLAGMTAVYVPIILVSVAFHVLRHSRIGIRFLAAACNPALASELGMKTGFWQWIGLSLGTFLMLLSGLFHACYYTYVNIGDAVGFLLLGIFSAVFVANGLCPRVIGFWNCAACLLACAVFLSIITAAIEFGVSPNLTKAIMGSLLLAIIAIFRFRHIPNPIAIG